MKKLKSSYLGEKQATPRWSSVTEKKQLVLISTVVLLSYYWIFSDFFPNNQGGLGHDYGYFLPQLLDGYFWWHVNGWFSVPWFSPSFCGGIPKFANFQDLYYSIPQMVTFITHPLNALKLSGFLFAFLGFLGCYLLLSRIMILSTWASLFGASCFLFNEFYLSRMIIGHLTFHAFMLTPFLSYFLMRPCLQPQKRPGALLNTVIGGILIAYMIITGMVHLLLPVFAALLTVAIFCQLKIASFHFLRFCRIFCFACIIAVCLSSAKLTAAFAYIRNFPRTDYILPGLSQLSELFLFAGQSLFVGPPNWVNASLNDKKWNLDQHEFEFGLSIVPLVLLLLLLGKFIQNNPLRIRQQFSFRNALLWGGMLLLLSLPICLNYYHPAWNLALKQLPLLKNSSNLFRWFALYIPVVVLLAAYAFERLFVEKRQLPVVILLLIALVVLHTFKDRRYYHQQIYPPKRIVEGYLKVSSGLRQPMIDRLEVSFNQDPTRMPMARNDTLVNGGSSLLCIEPMFGYGLEHFPIKPLFPGSVLTLTGNNLNLKKPACYLYPKENNCRPGDHFQLKDWDEAISFIHYRPCSFAVSFTQKVANILTIISLLSVSAFLIYSAVIACATFRSK